MTEDSMPSKRMVPAQEVCDLQEREVRLAAAKDAEIARLTAHGGEAYEEGWRAASTRSEELLNKIAAKDAEIALLRNTIGWEASVAYRTEIAALDDLVLSWRRVADQYASEIAALTADRDRWMADNKRLGQALINMNPALSQIVSLTEQRDEARANADAALLTVASVDAYVAKLTEQRDRAMKEVEAAREWADARRAAINECTPSTVDRLAKAEGDLAATVRALDAEAAAETAPSLPETP